MSDENSEYAWIIERYMNSELYYWAPQAGMQWSADHNMAVRFTRNIDAASVLAHICNGQGRVVRHGWINQQETNRSSHITLNEYWTSWAEAESMHRGQSVSELVEDALGVFQRGLVEAAEKLTDRGRQ